MKVLKFLDENLEKMLCVIFLALMSIIIVLQVFFRYVLNNSLSWSEELARYLFIWMIYIGISYGVKLDKHICVDAVYTFMPKSIKRGYAELGGEIRPVYAYQPGETTYFQRSGAPVVLEVRKGFFNDPQYDNDKTAILNLPAIDKGVWQAVEAVEAVSAEECAFHCTECLIPSLRDAIDEALEDGGLAQVNEFARELAQKKRSWSEAEFVRYKALLAASGQPSLGDAAQLLEEAEQYELLPEVAETWDYAELMAREKYPDLPSELFQTPQAAQIGRTMLEEGNGAITEYGLIRRTDGQPLPVFTGKPQREEFAGPQMTGM